jgi:Transposase DDE domain
MPTPPAPTRLVEYINAALAALHGHQRKATTDFVLALIDRKSAAQATLARFFDNFEAATKRLSRFVYNPRIELETTVRAHAAWIVTRLPRSGTIRIALDWTSEDTQHLLVASLIVGHRAIPLSWKAYSGSALKDRTHEYERDLIETLVTQVLTGVDRGRVLVTADRGFGDVGTIDLLDRLGVGYIIRAKGNVKVALDGAWRKLNTLRFRTNQRRRALGRVEYCQRSPRRVYLTHARARDRSGTWGIWFLISNRRCRAPTACREYGRRFGCEEGFRDSKRMLGFADARIASIDAWSRMFLLVAIALVVLIGIGRTLLKRPEWLASLLRRVCARRRRRSELSLVRAVTELLEHDNSLWDLLDHRAKLILEASL